MKTLFAFLLLPFVAGIHLTVQAQCRFAPATGVTPNVVYFEDFLTANAINGAPDN